MRRTITPARWLLASLLGTATPAAAQDTVAETAPVRITVGHPDVDGERLPHGRSTYLIELGTGDELRRAGEYSVEITRRAGGDERLIVQRTRGPDLQVVDSVLVRGQALTPVWYRMRSSRGRLDLRYEDGGRRVRGTEWTAGGETLAIDTTFAEARYPSTLAMVVVLALPLRAGYAAEMPLSRHGVATQATARVAARERFEGAAGTHQAWRVEVSSDGRPATRWIAVEDHHELATHARLPNGSTFRQTRVDLTEPAAPARSHLRAAVDAMGGESLLRGLGAVRIETIGYVNLLEQSERPDGPYLVLFEESTELRDPANGRLRRTSRSRAPQRPGWGGQLTRVFDGDVAAIIRGERTVPGRAAGLIGARESLALGPERLLLTALDAEDLHARADTTLQGVTHRVVAFTWRDRPVRIFLNAHTHLPTAVERTREHPLDQWSLWGDVTSLTLFSFWVLDLRPPARSRGASPRS